MKIVIEKDNGGAVIDIDVIDAPIDLKLEIIEKITDC